jgi:hypothetical protein
MNRLDSPRKEATVSMVRSAAGRAWTAFLLAAVLVVAGYATVVGSSAAFAQEDPPAPTVVPREDSSQADVVVPTSDEVAPDEGLIPPASDEAAPDEAVIAPAPDEGVPEEGLIAPAPDDGAPEEGLIAPAPDGGNAQDQVIAPAPNSQSSDSGLSPWVYALLAAVGLGVVAGTGTLVWRLRRERA